MRFLLVHHTQTPNNESPESVPARLRSMFRHHTGTKGWNDIAYNFLVDPFGGIWEGRAGSLAGPVKPDATGGSQGHAILGCFIGDHTVVPPTEAAQAAMSSLLAWLAARYQIDLFAGRNITFVSEGSNRWARGTSVVTDPIAGHRDMSRTECPGEAAYPLVRGRLLREAQGMVRQAESAGRPASTKKATTPPGGSPGDLTTAAPGATSVAGRTGAGPTTAGAAAPGPTTPGLAGDGADSRVAWLAGAGVAVAAATAWVAGRRTNS